MRLQTRAKALHLVAILAVIMASAAWGAAFQPSLAATTVAVGPHSVTYFGVRYDYPAAGQSTWYYGVTSSASSNAISHIVFQMGGCLTILGAGTWDGSNQDNLTPGGGKPVPSSFPASPITDPTTGVTGLKFDQGFSKDGETRYYYFTVNGNYAESSITVAIKAGGGEFYANITGPSLTCAIATASLGDYVWLDTDRDGIQDITETGIAGVTVRLYAESGTLIASTTTGESGYYLFTGLMPGNYYVEFVKPVASNYLYYFTLANSGSDDAKDSDANTTTGQTQLVSLTWGQVYLDLDAGFYRIPVTPSAVTVSFFEVLRDNDILNFKWRTEQEINNLGFDLFAVEPGQSVWLRLNPERILPQGLGIEPQDYYYQVERPGLAVGALFYLRAYDTDGSYQDFGPVEAIYSAAIMPPSQPVAPPAPPTVPDPLTPDPTVINHPPMAPRSEPVIAEPIGVEKPILAPAQPIVSPEMPSPGPIAPRPSGPLMPIPIEGARF